MSSKPQALTSIGPMRSFAANSKKIAVELIEINESLVGFNQYITQRALGAKSLQEAQKGVMFAAFLKLLMPLVVVLLVATALLAATNVLSGSATDLGTLN